MATAEPEPIRVAGQFELLANLGRGGMGNVYLARYRGQCLVAVKLLGRPPDGVSVQEINDRFERECRILLGLRHPSIVRAYTHGVSKDGLRFLVMEYVEGITLSDLRRRLGGPMSPSEAASLLLPLADSLCYCHSKRIFHRDITPHNVIVSDDGAGTRHAKLVDFGASWQDDAQRLTRGVVLGNLDFQPLERFQSDRNVDPMDMGETVDIYGLAAMAYFLTGGKGPAGALLTADERMGHSRITAGDDEAWAALLAWALHHDPSRRMASMNLFRSVLQSWVSDPEDGPLRDPFWMTDEAPVTEGVTAPTEPVDLSASDLNHSDPSSWVSQALDTLPPMTGALVTSPESGSRQAPHVRQGTMLGLVPAAVVGVVAAFLFGMTAAYVITPPPSAQAAPPCIGEECP